jgi:hypothetical protein
VTVVSATMLLVLLLLLLVVVLLPATAADVAATVAIEQQAPLPARLPSFSWDTVQTFIHGCQCERVLLNSTELEYVTKYNLAVVEKGHGSQDTTGGGGLLRGDYTIPALGAQLKRRNPQMFVLFYQNPLLDFLLSDVHVLATAAEAAGEAVFSRNTDGGYSLNFVNKTSPVGGACSKEAQNYPVGVRLYNVSTRAMRQILIDECVNATRTGSIDGCHIDRANWAEVNFIHESSGQTGNRSHQGLVQSWTAAQGRLMAEGQKLLLAGLQSAVGSNMLISAKENPVIGQMQDWQYTNTQYIEDCWCQGCECMHSSTRAAAVSITARLTRRHRTQTTC